MVRLVDEGRIAPVLDAIYDAAIDVDGWPRALKHLAGLFDSHFADLFARTDDWSSYDGIAIGLDRADYENGFLDQWSDRNVWSKASPAHLGGQVTPTWQMVAKKEVLRSAIYNEYLMARELNEGLRLMLWTGDGWLQDISLLRRWSAGPFAGAELDLARMMLPHIQRAASTSRRLQGIDALATFDTLGRPAFLLDARGRVMRQNGACEALLRKPGGLAIRGGYLEAGTVEDTVRLQSAMARAGCIGRVLPQASDLTLSGISPAAPAISVVPVRDRADRDLPAPRSVLVLAPWTDARAPVGERDLAESYGLTQAEAALAAGLLSGQALPAIAATRGRSINTLRAQLASIMVKTNTRRQGELILLLSRGGQPGVAVRA